MAEITVLPYCPILSHEKSEILRRRKMKNLHEKTAYYPAFLTYYPVESGKKENRGILRASLGSTPKGGVPLDVCMFSDGIFPMSRRKPCVKAFARGAGAADDGDLLIPCGSFGLTDRALHTIRYKRER
jgi:hypothetical protein